MRAMAVRPILIVLVLALAALCVLARPPIAQDPGYHDMADQRRLLGLPNALNVLSNVPFGVVGWWGLALTFRRRPGTGSPFADEWERWPYSAVFAGTVLTAIGSSYYHLAPDNGRLVWDRLPMTVGFLGLVVAVLAERVSVRMARLLLVPLLTLGVASVFYWHWTELRGAGDLRPYALVQFGSLLAVVLVLALYPGKRRGGRHLVAALACYAAAKGLEWADQPILDLGHVVSGHTLKHVVAAAAVAWVAAMLRERTAARGSEPAAP
jgi:hypothetical protein